ncbi:MAG: hypothetical protein HON21_14105, partial [Gammaproteobacteria bacterium]|nr:hypothetical protein [Gammaproteobacteria bacterium]
VAPNFSLRAMQELRIEFDAKPPGDRVDPASVDIDSNATAIDNPANA